MDIAWVNKFDLMYFVLYTLVKDHSSLWNWWCSKVMDGYIDPFIFWIFEIVIANFLYFVIYHIGMKQRRKFL